MTRFYFHKVFIIHNVFLVIRFCETYVDIFQVTTVLPLIKDFVSFLMTIASGNHLVAPNLITCGYIKSCFHVCYLLCFNYAAKIVLLFELPKQIHKFFNEINFFFIFVFFDIGIRHNTPKKAKEKQNKVKVYIIAYEGGIKEYCSPKCKYNEISVYLFHILYLFYCFNAAKVRRKNETTKRF